MTYRYLSVSSDLFLANSMIAPPPDSFLASDIDGELEGLRAALATGARFLCFSPDGQKAIFEKSAPKES